MFRRQAPRAQEEPIPEDLIASIPVVGEEATTEFETIEDNDVVLVTPAPGSSGQDLPEEDPLAQTTAVDEGSAGSALAAQLRYDLGEALARELDQAEAAISGAIADLEKRLSLAEQALVRAHEAAQREREGREQAEARLRAFKDLALK